MTIKAGQIITHGIPAGQVLLLACPVGTTGSAVRLSDIPGGDPYSPVTLNGANATFGPYPIVANVRIACVAGVITDTIGPVTAKAGTSVADNANPGELGEFLSASLPSVGVSITSGSVRDIATLALTPGDWDVDGVVDFLPAATTSITGYTGGISGTLNTLGGQDTSEISQCAAMVPNAGFNQVIPTQRFNVSVATTIHLVATATFTVSTLTAFGTIRARRMR